MGRSLVSRRPGAPDTLVAMETARTSSHDEMMAARYGTPGPGRRWVLIGTVAVLAVVSLGWLLWAAFVHATPEASSKLVAFEVLDDHTATAALVVDMDPGADVTCVVHAASVDGAGVGRLTFKAVPGRNDVTLRTERRATTVDKVGCTTPEQARPR